MKRIVLLLIFSQFLLLAHQVSFGLDVSANTTDKWPEYKIEITIAPDRHHLSAKGSMRLPADSSSREKLVFALSESVTNLKMSLVQPIDSAGPVKTEKLERPGVPAGLRRWTLLLPAIQIPRSGPVILEFSYTIENGLDSVFYVGPEGSFASGINTAWYPELEDENQFRMRGTGLVQFTVPPEYVAYTTGAQRGTAREQQQGKFQFQITNPVFFSFGVAKYTVHKSNRGLPIAVYLLRPRPTEKIQKLIDGFSRVIEALSQEFGPYPYPEFAVVEMPTEPARKGGSDGASLSGFMLGISTYFDQEFNTAFYGHEIAHTWWGNLIQRKGLRGAYGLDEGLAQYGSLRAVDQLEGSDAAEKYRRTGYPGYYSEYSGFTYLTRAAAGLDHKLSELPISDGFLSRRVTNSKGMLVWDMLARTVGRERFRSVLQHFNRRKAFQRVTWEEFLQAIQEGAGTDLKWFYEQWFERTGAPDLQMTWKQDGGVVRGVITQTAPYYKASVELEALGDDCRRMVRTVEVAGPKTEFSWPLRFSAKTLTLDPHFLLLRWTPEYRTEAMALLPYTRGDLKLSQGQTAEARAEFESALKLVPAQDPYGLGFMIEYGLAQALTEEGKIAEAKAHIQAALASPVRRAETLPLAYLQLALIAQKSKDGALLRWAVNAVANADAAAGGRTGAVEQATALLETHR